MADLERAIEQLRHHQTQLDMDGVMVGVSREALETVLVAVADDGWLPIDSAPHETLVVLGWWESDVWKQEIALASAGQRFDNGYSNRWQHGQASHWRPLPPAPAMKGNKDA